MKTETIAYTIDGAPYEGVLVYDPAKGPCPGVVMGPNWMGINEDTIARGRQLATDGGYTVFIADMYGRGKRPKNPGEAGALADPLRAAPLESRKRIRAALDELLAKGQAHGIVDASRLAAVGFCFGGGNVLDLARDGADVRAFVSIHGDLATPMGAEPGGVKGAVLAIHGAADPVAPKAQRDAFETEMTTAGCAWRLLVFGGIVHAFTDEGVNVPGVAVYDEHAARVTFAATYEFIKDAFDGRV